MMVFERRHQLLLACFALVGMTAFFVYDVGMPLRLGGEEDALPYPRDRKMDLSDPNAGALTILWWTKWFSKNAYPTPLAISCPARKGSANEGEMVRCVFTGDRSVYDEAAGVIFHARDLELRKLPSRRRLSQLWMYYSEENPLYDHRACGWYHRLNWNSDRQCDKVSLSPERSAIFNLRVGYQLDSDIPAIPYISTWLRNYTDQPMAPIAGKKNAVVWIANNCNSLNKREKYIEELMKWYPVDSYGDCLRNVEGKKTFISEEEMVSIYKRYKFAIAWENANCKDYVTEKLERAFQAGVLPIVDGPDDYSPFVPNNHSVIRVADFPGPRALAEHLKKVASDDKLYLEYFEYKPPKSRYDPAFLAFDIGGGDTDEECEICRGVSHELRTGGWKKRMKVDTTCKRRWWDREYYEDGTMSDRPTELWIEEWGFGSEDLVLWALGIGLLILVLGVFAYVRRRRSTQRPCCE